MPVTIIVGAQWGDEGKGRFVDWFAAEASVVARYAGGDNAGHTVAVDDVVYKLHLVPSGVLHAGVVGVLGNGMVINPVNLVVEIERLREQGVTITPDNLVISTRAHLITPLHIERDRAKEVARGEQAIGTTLRGIGPAYLDKTGRRGIRAGQMLGLEHFAEALGAHLEAGNQTRISDGVEALDVQKVVNDYVDAAAFLRPFIRETTVYLHERLQAGERIVCEGAQGTLLDVDHGSYPYVTSSSPTAGGALTGLGIGPMTVDRVVGVAKAFSTRVGSGPLPTELEGSIAEKLRGSGENFWDEFGTTTGRPRRCGWLDTTLLRYSAIVNGFSEMVLTKLDILSGFDELKIAVAYNIDGARHDFPPSTMFELEHAQPIYETMQGWDADITSVRTASDLPKPAIEYIKRISDLCDISIPMVSVGPERDQVVQL